MTITFEYPDFTIVSNSAGALIQGAFDPILATPLFAFVVSNEIWMALNKDVNQIPFMVNSIRNIRDIVQSMRNATEIIIAEMADVVLIQGANHRYFLVDDFEAIYFNDLMKEEGFKFYMDADCPTAGKFTK